MNQDIPTPVCDMRAVRMLSYAQSGTELYLHIDYAKELEQRAIKAELDRDAEHKLRLEAEEALLREASMAKELMEGGKAGWRLLCEPNLPPNWASRNGSDYCVERGLEAIRRMKKRADRLEKLLSQTTTELAHASSIISENLIDCKMYVDHWNRLCTEATATLAGAAKEAK